MHTEHGQKRAQVGAALGIMQCTDRPTFCSKPRRDKCRDTSKFEKYPKIWWVADTWAAAKVACVTVRLDHLIERNGRRCDVQGGCFCCWWWSCWLCGGLLMQVAVRLV